jgi:hypothetical protein
MSSGFKQVLLDDSLLACAVARASQDSCLAQEALTWYLALAASWRQTNIKNQT